MSRDIIVLDDDQRRHDVFDVWLEGHGVTHVYSAAGAAKAMLRSKFDVAFLDHDLGEGATTGSRLAEWMMKMPDDHRPSLVVIHSLNPVGASNMYSLLQRAGFNVQMIPFGSRAVKLV